MFSCIDKLSNQGGARAGVGVCAGGRPGVGARGAPGVGVGAGGGAPGRGWEWVDVKFV